MPNSRTSRPIRGDVALIDRHGQPGGETVEDAPAPESITFAEWCVEAEPFYIGRGAEPGEFTAWEAIKDAPLRVRNPRNSNWPGMFMHRLHVEGYFEYALDDYGQEKFTTSEKPESGGSAVRVWVGVEAKRKRAAA